MLFDGPLFFFIVSFIKTTQIKLQYMYLQKIRMI